MTLTLAALALALQAPADAPDLVSLSVLKAGDEACAVFDDAERALLDAAIARGLDDAVLAGSDPEALEAALARQTIVPRCNDARLANLARDHRARIEGLATYTELSFQGRARTWIVDRRPARTNTQPRWRVSQRTAAGDAIFGVAELGEDLQLVLAFNSETPFASAVIVARDQDRQPYPVDFTAGGLLDPPGRDGASAWGPSTGMTQRFLATDRLSAEAAATLAPASGFEARGFVFAPESLAALAQLTPREGVAIELRNRAGDVASQIWFEVGALQAALAMQAVRLIEIEDEPTLSTP